MFKFSLPQLRLDASPSRLHHRANLLLRHHPPDAVSAMGRSVAEEYLASGSGSAAHLLDTLPSDLFVPYVPGLRSTTGWSPGLWSEVLQSVCVLESMLGCIHGCEMCYIDAPLPSARGYMPWQHIIELLAAVADERRSILRTELHEVLVNELLRGRLKQPFSMLDAILVLVRHARNRFANYSDHLICYWKSNPTNWRDPLSVRDYADICAAVVEAFQLFQIEELVRLIDGDAASQGRFKSEFGEDIGRLYFATSTHAVTSTVPFAKDSVGDSAVQRIIHSSPLGSELVRVSIPHPNLIRTGRGNPSRYWDSVLHSLKVARPKLVYVFATNVDELLELVEHVAEAFETGGPPWWVDARLAMYEIRKGRENNVEDTEIIARLRKVLKKLCFMSRLEGKGKQFAGNPFFSPGSVMCVNGVVLAPGRKLHYQACTTDEGEDLLEGRIVEDIQSLDERDLRYLVTSHPLANRARELVTPGLANIPLHERRKPRGWFGKTAVANRQDARYIDAFAATLPAAQCIHAVLRF